MDRGLDVFLWCLQADYREKSKVSADYLTRHSCTLEFSFRQCDTCNLLLCGNRNIVYFPLALASFVLPHLASPFFKSIALKLGGGLEQRYSNYSSEGYVSGVQEWAAQSSWFIRITNDLVFYYLLLAIVVIQLSNRHLMNGKIERNLFSFLLLFLAFVNFGMPIPSFGERFMILFFLFEVLTL